MLCCVARHARSLAHSQSQSPSDDVGGGKGEKRAATRKDEDWMKSKAWVVSWQMWRSRGLGSPAGENLKRCSKAHTPAAYTRLQEGEQPDQDFGTRPVEGKEGKDIGGERRGADLMRVVGQVRKMHCSNGGGGHLLTSEGMGTKQMQVVVTLGRVQHHQSPLLSGWDR